MQKHTKCTQTTDLGKRLNNSKKPSVQRCKSGRNVTKTGRKTTACIHYLYIDSPCTIWSVSLCCSVGACALRCSLIFLHMTKNSLESWILHFETEPWMCSCVVTCAVRWVQGRLGVGRYVLWPVWGGAAAVQTMSLLREREEGDGGRVERKHRHPEVQDGELLLLRATQHPRVPGPQSYFI